VLEARIASLGHSHAAVHSTLGALLGQSAASAPGTWSAAGLFAVAPLPLAAAPAPRVLCGHTATVLAVVEMGAGRLASCGRDGTVCVWAVSPGDGQWALQARHKLANSAVACALAAGCLPWGALVAGLEDGRVLQLLWPGAVGGALEIWSAGQGHAGAVTAVAIVPGAGDDAGGQRACLASAGRDRALLLWEAAEGRAAVAVRRLPQLRDWVAALVPLGDGLLLSGGRDGCLRVWRAAEAACLHPEDGAPAARLPLPACRGVQSATVFAAAEGAPVVAVAVAAADGAVSCWRWDGLSQTLLPVAKPPGGAADDEASSSIAADEAAAASSESWAQRVRAWGTRRLLPTPAPGAGSHPKTGLDMWAALPLPGAHPHAVPHAPGQ